MPLKRGSSNKILRSNIEQLLKDGYPQNQALAIALEIKQASTTSEKPNSRLFKNGVSAVERLAQIDFLDLAERVADTEPLMDERGQVSKRYNLGNIRDIAPSGKHLIYYTTEIENVELVEDVKFWNMFMDNLDDFPGETHIENEEDQIIIVCNIDEYGEYAVKIEIDNFKDAAKMGGSWGEVDKIELRNQLTEASNAAELVKEAYLIVEDNWKDAPSEALKYPHHIIKDGKLVVSKDGIETALSFLMRIDPENIEAKNHLKRHYIELDLSTENFSLVDGWAKTGQSTPAPAGDRIKGSDVNKPGTAKGPGGDIEIDERTETGLKNKVAEHNEKMKRLDKPDWTRATLGQLKAVYRRGSGAYSTSHRPGVSRAAWAMARVNAYLYILKNGRPQDKKYITDNDLLPTGHPKSTRK